MHSRVAKACASRANQTNAEGLLWHTLNKRMFYTSQLKFRRQHPIGPYIVDFVCISKRLIVEVDGSQHGLPENAAYDSERTKWLESRGYRVLRVWNNDVPSNLDGVIQSIVGAIEERDTLTSHDRRLS